MKQFVGIKVFRCILIFICVLYILITGGIIGYKMLGAYQEHYTEETYLFLDKTCSFNDLFYDEFAEELYGVGISSKSFNRYQEDSPYWQKEGVKFFSGKQIDEYISLFRKMKFHPLEREEAIKISLQYTKKRSLTTIQMDRTPILRSDVVDNPMYSPKIYTAVIEKGFGVYEAGVFQVNDNYYMIADIVTHNAYVEIDDRMQPDLYEMSRAVFEIEPSNEIKELANRRDEFYVAEYYRFQLFLIPWRELKRITKIFAFLLIGWAVVYLFWRNRNKTDPYKSRTSC